jgi:hypothetical protein
LDIFANTNTNHRKVQHPHHMDKQKNAPRIRELMPDNYTVALSERTGCKNVSNLSQIVRLEHTNSKYWSAVEQLAQATDPKGFAAWKEAHESKLAA